MGKVVIERNSPDDIKMRDLYVRIDEGPEFNLPFGQSSEVDLPEGLHSIKVTNRLFTRKLDFDLGGVETLYLAAACIWLNPIFTPLFLISGTGPYKVRITRKVVPPEVA